MRKDNREYGIDLVKTLAIFLVVLVHGLGSTQLLVNPVDSLTTMIALIFRIISMISIPLFFISMGYLNSKYKFDLNYIKRFNPIFISYLLAVSFTLITEAYFDSESINFEMILSEFFNMDVSNYVWYARMYFMFFWIIPFLNKWFNSMDSKKEKKYFLLILISTVSLPALTNPFFKELSLNLSLPSYFVQMYPLLYYFIGMYIKENIVKINKIKLLIISTLIISIQLLFYIERFKVIVPNLNMFGSYGSFVNVVLATCIFLYCKEITIKRTFIKTNLIYISSRTFDIYLISHIFDRRIYQVFNQIADNIDERLLFLFFPILYTIIGSLVYVYLKDFFIKIIIEIKNYIVLKKDTESI